MSKTNYIAVHQVARTKTPGKPGDKAKGLAPTAPVTETVEPGQPIVPANEQEEKDLLAAGAIRVAPEADVAAAEEAAKAKTDVAAAEEAAKAKAEAAAAEEAAKAKTDGGKEKAEAVKRAPANPAAAKTSATDGGAGSDDEDVL